MKIINTIKPILFSTPMVQAIVDGSKSQTRREINATTPEMIALMINIMSGARVKESKEELLNHSRIKKDNILWVREAWNYSDDLNDPYLYRQIILDDYLPQYHNMYKWKPSIHMPKDAARIFLKVIDVRIELLQDITAWDAWKEGVKAFNEDYTSEEGAVHGEYENYLWVDKESYEDYCFPSYTDPVLSFQSLWRKINGLESWDINPLVWVIEFETGSKPENFI